MAKNPKWLRDEILLAVDLYYQIDNGKIGFNHPDIIELSELLNKLPLHIDRPDATRFRNPNGVALKLTNFLHLDPEHPGKGMNSHSKLDEVVFNEFRQDKAKYHRIAQSIREAAEDPEIVKMIAPMEIGEDVPIIAKEGNVIYKLHRYLERNKTIVKKKKAHYFKKYGRLDCEVCGFEFVKRYGELGKGFIECHHRKPLHLINKSTTTTLADLALVCANCHRMLHISSNLVSVDELKERIQSA